MIGQLSDPWWVFVALGVVAGVVSGVLGIGSGIIFVPALGLLCGFSQKSAQGMSLAVMVPLALLGALRYWQNPQVEMNFAVIVLVVCGGLVGTLFGTELAARLSAEVLRKAFAVVLVAVAVKMFVTPSTPKQLAPAGDLTSQNTVSSTFKGGVSDDGEKQ